MSNGRIAVLLGPVNAIANLAAPKPAELAAMLLVSEAIRWDGWDFGRQESERVDDRSIADDASAQIAGFAAFGGSVPWYWPTKDDQDSVLRKVYDLLKPGRTEFIWVERVGFKAWNEPIVAGDEVNVYRVMNDGWNDDTEGTGGYAYITSMLPKGDVYTATIVAPDGAPAAVTVTAITTTVDEDTVGLLKAMYQGNDITKRASWKTDDGDVARVEAGLVVGYGPGTATITASFPGATDGTLEVTSTATEPAF